MTGRTVSELREEIIRVLSDPMTVDEVAGLLREPRHTVLAVMTDMAGKREIRFAEGTNGKKWTRGKSA